MTPFQNELSSLDWFSYTATKEIRALILAPHITKRNDSNIIFSHGFKYDFTFFYHISFFCCFVFFNEHGFLLQFLSKDHGLREKGLESSVPSVTGVPHTFI